MTPEDLVELQRELPPLEALARKVATVHGAADPRLIQVHEALQHAGPDSFTQLRTLTDAYQVPAHACRSYRALLEGLRKIDEELQA